MILLAPDCLLIEFASGERVPCSAAAISVELFGEVPAQFDGELVHNAAAAVFHHFKNDLGQMSVTASEFSAAMKLTLNAFGLQLQPQITTEAAPQIPESDLRLLAVKSGKTDLLFYSCLREELRRLLGESPRQLRFCGLRGCVKQLAGNRRWSIRCQRLETQILAFLHQCLRAETKAADCTLVVR